MAPLFKRKSKTEKLIEQLEEYEESYRELRTHLRSTMERHKNTLKREWEKFGEIRSKGLLAEWRKAKKQYEMVDQIYTQIKAKRIQAERQALMGDISTKFDSKHAAELLRLLGKTEQKQIREIQSIYNKFMADVEHSAQQALEMDEGLIEMSDITDDIEEEFIAEAEADLLDELGIKSKKKAGVKTKSKKKTPDFLDDDKPAWS